MCRYSKYCRDRRKMKGGEGRGGMAAGMKETEKMGRKV